MAQINEAWRILSDPARRAVYDSAVRTAQAARRAAPAGSMSNDGASRARTATEYHAAAGTRGSATPASFPWRFMVGVAVAGILFVLVNAALTKPGGEPVPDNLMEVGSCVDILDNGDAKETTCAGAYDGVVSDLRPPNSICSLTTELHRDRQGMGNLCVRMVVAQQ